MSEKYSKIDTLNKIRSIHPKQKTTIALKLEEVLSKIIQEEKDDSKRRQ